MNGKVKHNLTR